MPTSLIRNFLWGLAVLSVLLGAARLTCLRWWQVPLDDADLGASVTPTLNPGDWVILWRLTAPGFGDLVLCPDPEDPAQVVMGRIVGEGGDHLSISDIGDLQVNGSNFHSEKTCDVPQFVVRNPRNGDEVKMRCDVEALGGVHHKRALFPVEGRRPLPVKTEVEDRQLYLVSDNRFYPFDSRDFGTLPRESCSETVVFRLVSRLGFGDVAARLSWIQ
jgi:signal peptidase I